MKIGGLFFGYGGLDMAVQQVLGGELAWVSEIDKGALKVINHRHPGVPNLGDVTKVDWSTVEPVDVLTGGSPCQDLSHAGKRAGMTEGTRSNLWVAMREAIAVLRPRLVVWENVRGAYSAAADSALEPCPGCMGDGRNVRPLRALGRVLGDLADIGYDARWHGLRASEIGAPHQRFRVFLVAYPGSEERPRRSGLRESEPTGQRRGRPGDSADASLLLPTPRATDGTKGGPNQRGSSGDLMLPSAVVQHLLPTPDASAHKFRLGGDSQQSKSLEALARRGELLPTPEAADGSGGRVSAELGGFRDSGAKRAITLATAVAHTLLPTPAVNDMGEGKTPEQWDEWTAAMKAKHANGNGHGNSLSIEAQRLLPTPSAAEGGQTSRSGDRIGEPLIGGIVRDDLWGRYAEAIARWEAVTRPAPAPTEVGQKGNPRLSPRFSEWMMGLPDGWITDVPDITRNEALKACGNGVVPQQAAAALRIMLGDAA